MSGALASLWHSLTSPVYDRPFTKWRIQLELNIRPECEKQAGPRWAIEKNEDTDLVGLLAHGRPQDRLALIVNSYHDEATVIADGLEAINRRERCQPRERQSEQRSGAEGGYRDNPVSHWHDPFRIGKP